MVRVKGKTSGKAKGWADIKEWLPGKDEYQGANTPPSCNVTLVVDDGLQCLNKTVRYFKKATNSNTAIQSSSTIETEEELADEPEDSAETMKEKMETVALSDIMERMGRMREKEYGNVRIYVHAFDRQDNVPIAKSDEQEKRNEVAEAHCVAHDEPLQDIDLDDLNTLIPHFTRYIGDRDCWRKKIIANICKRFLSRTGKYGIRPLPGCMVVLEGHCLTVEEATREGVLLGGSVTDPYNTPIVISRKGEDDPVVCSWNKPLCSYIGEADFSPFFYLNYVTDGLTNRISKTMEIISTDTDLIYFSLVYLYNAHKLREQRPDLAMPHIRIRRPLSAKNEEWVDTNALYAKLHTKLGTHDSIIDLLVVMMGAGGDFVCTHSYVTHKKFLVSWSDNRQHIGPLFSIVRDPPDDPVRQTLEQENYFPKGWILPTEIRIDARNYLKVMKFAHGYANPSRIDRQTLVKLNPWHLNRYFAAHVATDPDTGEQATKRAIMATRFMPEKDDIEQHILQLLYYMRMVFSVGLAEVKTSRVLQYGYELRDPTLPLQRGNITKTIIGWRDAMVNEKKTTTTKKATTTKPTAVKRKQTAVVKTAANSKPIARKKAVAKPTTTKKTPTTKKKKTTSV